MSLIVSYDAKDDILKVSTGERVETSATCEQDPGLIIDFKSEEDLDPVGFELCGAAKLLAPILDEMRRRAAAEDSTPAGG